MHPFTLKDCYTFPLNYINCISSLKRFYLFLTRTPVLVNVNITGVSTEQS